MNSPAHQRQPFKTKKLAKVDRRIIRRHAALGEVDDAWGTAPAHEDPQGGAPSFPEQR